MFLIYINDIGSNIKLSHMSVCWWLLPIQRKEIQIQDDTKFQKDLTALQGWSQSWQMQFNTQICFAFSVTKRGHQQEKRYSLNGHITKSVDHCLYIGVELQNDLKWSHHIPSMTNKASRSLGIGYRTVSFCPAEVRVSGYYTQVRPHLDSVTSSFRCMEPSLQQGCEEAWGHTKESSMIHHWKQEKDWGKCHTDLGRIRMLPQPSSPMQSPETKHSPQVIV